MQNNMNRRVFSAWMGPGAMSKDRENALLSIIKNNGCLNLHITKSTLNHWIHPEFPLHEAFNYLSAVHQCDYLRCYFLNVYGGGYTDVKNTTTNWWPLFDVVHSTPDSIGIGYTEVGPQGIAQVGGILEDEMKLNFTKIIGVCAMIFKPRSKFTIEWALQLHKLLDERLESLKLNPARHPQDRFGAQFMDGTVSSYPFKWTEVGGDIFHPLAYKFHKNIIHANMAPSFVNYR